MREVVHSDDVLLFVAVVLSPILIVLLSVPEARHGYVKHMVSTGELHREIADSLAC